MDLSRETNAESSAAQFRMGAHAALGNRGNRVPDRSIGAVDCLAGYRQPPSVSQYSTRFKPAWNVGYMTEDGHPGGASQSARAVIAALLAQFLRFAAVGTVTTGVQYVVLWFGVAALRVPAAAASAAGYTLGVLLSYCLNYRFTFQSRQAHAGTLQRYAAVYGVGWCVNAGLMVIFVHRLGWDVWVSQVLTTGSGLLWNFSGSRWWAFRHREA
jgi:putative flippase GtrA